MRYLVRATYQAAVSTPPGSPWTLYLKDVDAVMSSWTDRQDAASRVGAAEAVRLVAEMAWQFYDVALWVIEAVALEEVTGG